MVIEVTGYFKKDVVAFAKKIGYKVVYES